MSLFVFQTSFWTGKRVSTKHWALQPLITPGHQTMELRLEKGEFPVFLLEAHGFTYVCFIAVELMRIADFTTCASLCVKIS